MLRKALGLVMLLSVVGVLTAQTKDKDKKEPVKDTRTKAVLVKADVDKKMLIVTVDGKRTEYLVTKDVKFVGPRGGKREEGLKDDVLQPGAELRLVVDGRTLKEVHLPVRKAAPKDKDKAKPKDKGIKDKDGKDKK